jgi:SAM-dependent methyltransferase
VPPKPTPKPLSAEYFDDWYADKAAAPAVAEMMNRHLGLPSDLSAGVVPADAIGELAAGLRLSPGDALLDLACGRGGYGLMIARETGARLTGVDFSAQAITEARAQAARLGVTGAEFRVGDLTASGLPGASADAVLCTDSIQFPDDPAAAYAEIRRVLRAGGRVVLTCWEPVDPADERLAPRLRVVDLAAGLRGAGFTSIEVREQPSWRARERALWEEAVAIDPGDDLALLSFRDEAARSLGHFDLIRRVMAVATAR